MSSNKYFVHVNFDKSFSLLSTSPTADPSLKIFNGYIHIESKDEKGIARRVSTQYNAVRVNMNSALYNGLNAVNFILGDGEYLPWNEHVKEFPINSLSGVPFQITTLNSAVEGTNVSKPITIFFEDLMNPEEEGIGLEFILDTSMENWSSTNGKGLNNG